MMNVELRYFAAARAARGERSETIAVPAGATIGDALARVVSATPARSDSAPRDTLPAVLDRCSFLVNAISASDAGQVLSDGDTIDVLPPFAGG